MTESKTELRTFSELSRTEQYKWVLSLKCTMIVKHGITPKEAAELHEFLLALLINRSFDSEGKFVAVK